MVGKNIAKLRKENKLTQEELAEKLYVTRQAVSNWETGKTEPDIETLQKIADEFNVSIEEIIYGEKQEKNIITAIKADKEEYVKKGISFGSALAMIISYVTYKSVGWAIVHGLLGWIYVIYFVIRY